MRPRKHISLTTGERADHTQMTQCVCDRGSHQTATSVKVLFFIFILFLKPQYHPLTFHLNEHYPQQCLRAAGNISWPLAALMCHVPLDVWEVPIHPPQGSLHYRIDAAIYSLCTILLNNRCCCSDHFASYALIRSSSVFSPPPKVLSTNSSFQTFATSYTCVFNPAATAVPSTYKNQEVHD